MCKMVLFYENEKALLIPFYRYRWAVDLKTIDNFYHISLCYMNDVTMQTISAHCDRLENRSKDWVETVKNKYQNKLIKFAHNDERVFYHEKELLDSIDDVETERLKYGKKKKKKRT